MPSDYQTHTLQIANLKDHADNAFDLRPDAETCNRIASDLRLLSLRKLSIKGGVQPDGQRGAMGEERGRERGRARGSRGVGAG